MKISNRTHRALSVLAAVFILIWTVMRVAFQLITIFTILDNPPFTTLLDLGGIIMVNLLLIVILFRGKKDNLAGILLILASLYVVVTGILGRINIIFTYLFLTESMLPNMAVSIIASNAIYLIGSLVAVAFRGFLAAECFNPGNISGEKLKFFLLVLPIVYVLIGIAGSLTNQLYLIADYGIAEYLLAGLLQAVVSAIPNAVHILVGLAFAIPVYEQIPAEAIPDYQESNCYN